MSTKPDLPDQPWFIRQVHQRTWSDRDDDDVLPMRLPPAPPENVEPARDADPALSGSASDWFGGYRPFPGYTPLAAEDASAGDGVASGNRATPDDPGWLDWTAPPMEPATAATARRELRLPLIGLGLLAVLLAFAAGWAVSAWVKRDVGAVPATPVDVPLVAPPVAVTAPIVNRPVERVREAAPPKTPVAKVAKVAKPAKVVKPAKLAKPAAKKSAVKKAPPARAKPVIEVRHRPAAARAAKPVPAAITRPKTTKPRESWAERAVSSDQATSRETRPEPSAETTVRSNDAESLPATAAPTNLLSAIEPAEDAASSPRAIARERTEKQPKAQRRLPRCVGFQISRPNVACRVGGPR